MKESTNDKVTSGFWVYLMSDCVLFAALFATYAVLQNEVFGGPSAAELFDLPFVLTETMILLTSSFTIGLALVAALPAREGKTWPSGPERPRGQAGRWRVLFLLLITLLLGLSFLGMEVYEFRNLILEGHGPDQSAFLSSFFTLVGTHGLHVALGSVWMIVVMAHVWLRGVAQNMGKLLCLSLFWHFLDVVWIFIFTFVYLMGAVAL